MKIRRFGMFGMTHHLSLTSRFLMENKRTQQITLHQYALTLALIPRLLCVDPGVGDTPTPYIFHYYINCGIQMFF